MNIDQELAERYEAMRNTRHQDEYSDPTEAEIDLMYNTWKNNYLHTNIIKSSDMDRFAPLFSKELARKVYTGENYRREEEEEIEVLSNEYASLVDLYQPVYVVSDMDYLRYESGEISAKEASELAKYVLPPHFMRLHQTNNNREYLAAFSKYSAMESTGKGTPTAIKRDAMAKAIQQNLGASTSLEEIDAKRREFAELSEKFMEYNKGTETQEETATVAKQEAKPDDFLDFD